MDVVDLAADRQNARDGEIDSNAVQRNRAVLEIDPQAADRPAQWKAFDEVNIAVEAEPPAAGVGAEAQLL